MSLDYEVWLINTRGRAVRRPAREVPDLVKQGFYQWTGPGVPKQSYYPQYDKSVTNVTPEKIIEEMEASFEVQEILDVIEI